MPANVLLGGFELCFLMLSPVLWQFVPRKVVADLRWHIPRALLLRFAMRSRLLQLAI